MGTYVLVINRKEKDNNLTEKSGSTWWRAAVSVMRSTANLESELEVQNPGSKMTLFL